MTLRSGSAREAAQAAQLLQSGLDEYSAGRREAALDYWQRALIISPADVRARAYVAWAEWSLHPRNPDEVDSDDRATREATLIFSSPAPARSAASSASATGRTLARDPRRSGHATHEFVSSSYSASSSATNPGASASISGGVSTTDIELETPSDPDEEAALLEQLGPLSAIVVAGVPPAQLKPRAAFLLSRADGTLTLDDLLDVSGMPRLDALRMIVQLLDQGALVLR